MTIVPPAKAEPMTRNPTSAYRMRLRNVFIASDNPSPRREPAASLNRLQLDGNVDLSGATFEREADCRDFARRPPALAAGLPEPREFCSTEFRFLDIRFSAYGQVPYAEASRSGSAAGKSRQATDPIRWCGMGL